MTTTVARTAVANDEGSQTQLQGGFVAITLALAAANGERSRALLQGGAIANGEESRTQLQGGFVAITLALAVALVLLLSGCAQQGGASGAGADAGSGLYFSQQEVRESPEWVTKLDAAKDADQLIVVAGVDKNTAYVTMHEKDTGGTWHQIIATPGFIGLDGLGKADIDHARTPVGTFTIDKAFGLAEDPGCKMDYTQVDDTYYWSGDGREGMRFNELVSTKELPGLDTENSEHIAEFDYAYRYVLNMGYNSECVYENGFGFFLHSFRVNRPYTGGCVAVPEDIMKFVMQHVQPGCKITIDSLDHFGGDLDA